MTEELHINARLEGFTKFTIKGEGDTPASEHQQNTAVIVECGLSGWKDEPYRAQVYTSYPNLPAIIDIDDKNEERRFSSSEELSTWLDKYISELRAKGFELVRYKANGLPVDWLAGVNLPY